jgi:hypothetical protein
MKKRKAPIVLLTIIGVLVAIATIVNVKAQQAAAMPDLPETAVSEGPRDTPSKDAIAGSMKESMSVKGAAKPNMPVPGGSGPLIEKPGNIANIKPTPNESGIHGQWYSDEHTKDFKKGH